jgi:Ca2+/Na+ antiporter
MNGLYMIKYEIRGPGRINRSEGVALTASYIGYLVLLIVSVMGGR